MKLTLLSLMLIISIGVYTQQCIVVNNDTISFDEQYLTTVRVSGDNVKTYEYGYLNELSGWTNQYTLYYLEGNNDTLIVNPELVYITYWNDDEIIRDTWAYENTTWNLQDTHVSSFTTDMRPLYTYNDTMWVDLFYDVVGGLYRIESNDVIIDYDFDSQGRIATETHNDTIVYEYEYTDKVEKILQDYKWTSSVTEDYTTIEYLWWNTLLNEWVILNQESYLGCWFYVNIPEINHNNKYNETYYNILGQEILKPNTGFYITKGTKYFKN